MLLLRPPQSELLALAPSELRNYRTKRYHGDDIAIPVSVFTESDQQLLGRLYTFLQTLFASLGGEGDARQLAFQRFLDTQDLDDLTGRVRQLGAASYRLRPTPLLAKTIHDIRGGGLSPLLGELELWRLGLHRAFPGDSLYFLTRDHLKIMRNALLGLDDARRNDDLEIKVHDTDFFVQKWNGTQLISGEKRVRLTVDCRQPVAISECCVEFGALDRILYNLINNACRHTVGESIQLVVFPVPDEQGENLRFVLLNALSPADNAYLSQTDMQALFRAGVSTTGSGYGLNVAAEFVTNAFGLTNPKDAVTGGYLGARLLHEQFAIWFHWPIVAEY